MDSLTSQYRSNKPKKRLERVVKYLDNWKVRDRLDKALLAAPVGIYYLEHLECLPKFPTLVNSYILPAIVLAGFGDIMYRACKK